MPDVAQSMELLWCYRVPVETLFEDFSEDVADRMSQGAVDQDGIYCGAERPAAAKDDALLPIAVDRQARTLVLEGGLDVNASSVVVRIAGLEPGEWTERKRVYNLSERPWNGWQVTMGNADLVLPPDALAFDAWAEADSSVATALHPEAFHASVNYHRNAVYFGATMGPSGQSEVLIQPGEYIEKQWRFTVSDEPRYRGDVIMSHGSRVDPNLADDVYAYQPGPLAGADGGLGFAGAWQNVGGRPAAVTGTSLIYPAGTLPSSGAGRKVRCMGDTGAPGAIRRAFDAPIGDSGGPHSVWIRVLIQPSTDGGFNGVSLMGSAGSDMFLGWVDEGPQRVWAFKKSGSGNGGHSNVSIGSSLGEPTLLVGRIDFSGDPGAETLSLFINPGPQEPPSGQAAAIFSGVDFGDLTELRLVWSRPGFVDELRTASTYAGLAQ